MQVKHFRRRDAKNIFYIKIATMCVVISAFFCSRKGIYLKELSFEISNYLILYLLKDRFSITFSCGLFPYIFILVGLFWVASTRFFVCILLVQVGFVPAEHKQITPKTLKLWVKKRYRKKLENTLKLKQSLQQVAGNGLENIYTNIVMVKIFYKRKLYLS